MANHLKTRLEDLVSTIATKLNLLKSSVDSKASKSTTITSGTGMQGGGDLSANRTLSISSATMTKINHGESAYNGLDNKVDKVAGKGLSTEDYTTAEKQKLAGLESSKFKGKYTSLANLKTAFPEGSSDNWSNGDGGFYADVDDTGQDVVRYIYDATDKKWVASGLGAQLTAAQVKTMYESNADTNAFTDSFKSKLNGIATGAEVNVQADWNVSNTNSDAYIKNKPSIPSVGNGTISLSDNGTSIGSFSLNQAANETIPLNENYPDYQGQLLTALNF